MFHTPRLASPLAGLKDPPSRLLIAKWGRNESVNEPFTVNATTAKFLPILQRIVGWDTVALDFEHNTVPGTPAFKADKEPRNVAAHAALSVVEGEGIYAENIQWTPHGVKSVTEGLHPDLSPTIKTNDAGEVVLMHSAALCRAGAVMDLKVFSALDLADLVKPELFAAYSAALSTQPKSTSASMDYKKLLLLMLGLDANAADTEIETASKALGETLSKARKVSEAMETHSTTLTKANDAIVALTKRLDDAERAALLSAAIGAGKLVPHGAEIDKLNNAALAAVLATLPADIVPLAQRTVEGVKTYSAPAVPAGANEADDAVRQQLGISKEEWAKN
jgi:phage I-like protein